MPTRAQSESGFQTQAGTGKLRVLVCETSGVQRQILSARLAEEGFEVETASNGQDAFTLIQANTSDILITGVELPDFSGLELCWKIKSDPDCAHIHTIVLSASNELARLAEALDSGADDFLRKPWNDAEFRARLRAASRIVRLQQRLVEEASIDALTGVMNRRSLLRSLERDLDSCRLSAAPIHLAMIDLDRFKSINDTHGHASGDAVLVHLAVLVRGFLKRGERFGRLGGEEFALVLPHTDRNSAEQRCEALRGLIEANPAPVPGGNVLAVTASLGLAGALGKSDEYSAALLLDQADEALYRAKSAGRNQVCLAA